MKIPVGVSNRHVHLKEETFKELFGDVSLTKRNDLTQPDEYAANETVMIKTAKDKIEKVRILGPFREYNQVEISKTDAYHLGINPPVRKSGDLENSESITLVGPQKEIFIQNGVIISERHIHMDTSFAKENNFGEDEKVYVKISGVKPGIITASIKTSDNAYLELHLDTDDANAFLLKNGDEVEILK
ncbi:MAG TPA: phosphate propanoyltransferase [Bacilli bacterium]|nr:phosphate propanoyltransferase [Bacilli bacterium]